MVCFYRQPLFWSIRLRESNESLVLSRFTSDEGGKARRWRDGSLEEDLPMRGLAEMFNVNYFICSQTNPHIVPALNIKRHLNRTFSDILEHEFKHRWGYHPLSPLVSPRNDQPS